MTKPDGLELQIEIEPRRLPFRTATPTGPVLVEASGALGDLGAGLENATAKFAEKFPKEGPAEVTLELDLRLSVDGKWLVVAAGEGVVTAKVSMTWKRSME